MLIRVLGIFLLSTLFVATPSFAQDDGEFEEPEYSDVIGSFVGAAAGAIEEKCSCPESESGLANYQKCLTKQGKKANDGFKKALRFTGESASEFKSVLAEELDFMYADCEAGFDVDDGEEEPGDGDFEEF